MGVFKRESRKTRHKTQLGVWLTLDGGFAKRPCTVIDLSATGARLSVQNGGKLGRVIGKREKAARDVEIAARKSEGVHVG